MEILTQAGQFILSLSLLITLHELGHFVAARAFGMRVEKFYLFFDYKFSLIKKKIGETVYGIGWIPFGGYVKIAGMVDESMDKEQLKEDPKPWEFRSKPAWQRLIVMLGGIIVNALLGWLIFSMILFVWGKEYLANEDAQYGIAVDSMAHEIGLYSGDKILTIDGESIERFNDINMKIALNYAEKLEVDRAGQSVDIDIPSSFKKGLLEKQGLLVSPRMPFIIDTIPPSSRAAVYGFEKGDSIVGANGKDLGYYDEIRAEIAKRKGGFITLKVARDGQTHYRIAEVSATGAIGVYAKSYDQYFKMKQYEYGFFESFGAGFYTAWDKVVGYVQQFRLVFDGEAQGYKHVGGFISMGKIFPPQWDWYAFWNLTGWFSVVLAFMNLLPIPVLDGGHVMFTLYEMVTGRKPGDKFMEVALTVGLILVIGLMLYANGNDLFKLFR